MIGQIGYLKENKNRRETEVGKLAKQTRLVRGFEHVFRYNIVQVISSRSDVTRVHSSKAGT